MGVVPKWLIVDLIRLDSSCNEGLVPTVASLFHRRRNKPSKVPMESWDLALSNGASASMIGPFLHCRPTVQSGYLKIAKRFRKRHPYSEDAHVIVISLKM